MLLLLSTLLLALAVWELRREMLLPTASVPDGILVAGLVIRILVLVLVPVLASFWLAVLAGRL